MAVVDYPARFRAYNKKQLLSRELPALQIRLQRRGKKVIAARASDIPAEICLKCGEISTRQHKATFVSEQWIRGILIMLIPIPIPGLSYETKKVKVRYGLCGHHNSARVRRQVLLTTIALGTPLVGIAVIAFFSGLLGSFILFLWPVICLIAMALSRSITGKPTPEGIVITGAGQEMLDLIPEQPL